MKTYRNLASEKIVETLSQLAQRIDERFPKSGLYWVCKELETMAEQTKARAEKIARPNIPLLAAIWLLLGFAAAIIVWLATRALNLEASTELTNVMQGVDAGVSLLIVLGGAAFYLSSLESRWRRGAVLKTLHEFRSIAHVVDMHQLTKDPEQLLSHSPDTASSPVRIMTRVELGRYLDYCSEMLSLTSKIAALFVERFDDPVTLGAVNEIESLTAGLSRKIWQKISMLLDTADVG